MQTTRPRSHGLLPRVVLAAFSLLVMTGFARAGDDKDNWFFVEMLGQRAGWMHTTTVTKAGKTTTTSKMQLDFSRASLPIKISMESSFIETTDGKPVRMTAVKQLSAKPITDHYVFQDDGSIKLTTDQDGAARTNTLPKPDGVWLTPAAADKYVLQRFKSGAKEVTVRSMDPLEGATPITMTRSGFEKTTLTIDGRKVDATKVTVDTSAAPGIKSTEYVDGEGELIRSETMMGGIGVNMIATTREKALKDAPAPEIMISTFIKPDKPIKDPRDAKKAVLTLSLPDGDFQPLPNTGSQLVEVLTPTSQKLTITTREAKTPAEAPAADAADPAHLKATALANSEDPKIKELAKEAVAKAGDSPLDKAEACRKYVYRYITKKDLGVGFASASEVATTRQGDCTEHGVLLVALLRANGIPARAATGLVYADEFEGSQGIFGYHMWAQALLTIDGKPRWVDLDATLSPQTPFDATHITLSTTDLPDGESSAGLAAIAPLMGRLKIKVDSAE